MASLGWANHNLAGEETMNCKSCNSDNQQWFASEINIHFPGLKNLDKPTVFVFPQLVVCMDCGFTEFAVPETELGMLRNGTAARETATSRKNERLGSLSSFVAGSCFRTNEIDTCERAADKPLALQHAFYRH